MRMYHPNVDNSAEVVSRRVFETAYEPLGWLLVDPDVERVGNVLGKPIKSLDQLTPEELASALAALPVVPPPVEDAPPDRATELDAKTKDELIEIAAGLDLELTTRNTKAEIVEAVVVAEAARAEQEGE